MRLLRKLAVLVIVLIAVASWASSGARATGESGYGAKLTPIEPMATSTGQARTAGGAANRFSLVEATVDDVRSALASGQVSCSQLIDLYLQRIDAFNRQGPSLNAVETVNPNIRQDAARLDEQVRQGLKPKPLHCVPVLVKDQLETVGIQTAFGSAVFKGFVPVRDATAVARLKEAGALILGKATMGEFAQGLYAGSISGPIRTPYDASRHAGGSSGGVGSGIAANLATVGIGEDTGGSIRGPASINNLVGLRPTVGMVSRFGMFPSRPAQDTAGPLTRTVRDTAIIMDVIGGFDPNDPLTAYSVGRIQGTFASHLDAGALKGARLGVITQPMSAFAADPGSADYKKNHEVFDRAIGEVRGLGVASIEAITIPDLLGHLSRGRDSNASETEQAIAEYLAQHPTAPVKTLKDILLTGKVIPSAARQMSNSLGKTRNDREYLLQLRNAEDTRRTILSIMAANKLDALVYISADLSSGPVEADVMTNPAAGSTQLGSNRSFAAMIGFPAIVVPGGFTDEGLPVGIEIMGRPFDDAKLVGYAYAYEQATHHRRAPAATRGSSPQ